MAKGTTFGAKHSDTDLHLIQQSVEISPAEPRTSYVDVPGADGAKDLTEALGVGVKFKDRTIKWTFGLYPGDSWETRKTAVSNALNGLACHIILDDDPSYYYDGRLAVKGYKIDGMLKQITVEAICRPYKLKFSATQVYKSGLTTSYKTVTLNNDRMPVVPEIYVGQATTLKWKGATYTLNAGTHTVPEICLAQGSQTIQVKLVSGSSGEINFLYREGAL